MERGYRSQQVDGLKLDARGKRGMSPRKVSIIRRKGRTRLPADSQPTANSRQEKTTAHSRHEKTAGTQRATEPRTTSGAPEREDDRQDRADHRPQTTKDRKQAAKSAQTGHSSWSLRFPRRSLHPAAHPTPSRPHVPPQCSARHMESTRYQ